LKKLEELRRRVRRFSLHFRRGSGQSGMVVPIATAVGFLVLWLVVLPLAGFRT
jgi:hypothetical protein